MLHVIENVFMEHSKGHVLSNIVGVDIFILAAIINLITLTGTCLDISLDCQQL